MIAAGNESAEAAGNSTYAGGLLFPPYVRAAYVILCVVILGIGIVGNVMVPLVIVKTKDMRNSTNIFLINLSVADLMVLLVCTPTVLVEVNSEPLIWVLGEEMCKAVPFVELTVAHASVLTILAISFERYYAICQPLRAGYVCTKARAMLICLLAWAFAALFTSPVLMVSEYREEEYVDGTNVTTCLMDANDFWPSFYFTMSTTVFFCLPLGVLVGLYSVIARHLLSNHGLVAPNNQSAALRYRRQVVLMLGTVVTSFFICLLPFKAFTLYVIYAPSEFLLSMGIETFYNILYICRMMFYINSAINPILYNLMSSKFRDGFRKLLGISRVHGNFARKGTVTTTTTLTSSTKTSSSDNLLRKSVVRVISLDDSSKVDNGLSTTIKLLNSSIIKSDESYV